MVCQLNVFLVSVSLPLLAVGTSPVQSRECSTPSSCTLFLFSWQRHSAVLFEASRAYILEPNADARRLSGGLGWFLRMCVWGAWAAGQNCRPASQLGRTHCRMCMPLQFPLVSDDGACPTGDRPTPKPFILCTCLGRASRAIAANDEKTRKRGLSRRVSRTSPHFGVDWLSEFRMAFPSAISRDLRSLRRIHLRPNFSLNKQSYPIGFSSCLV